MADYVLTNKADADLDEIYAYSFRSFGEVAADEYLSSLGNCLQRLADEPLTGRSAEDLNPGLLKHRHARHVIFYMIETPGILVVRVLHDSMDHSRHIDRA